ncbi:glycerophosphodiester phosphodiesterase [Roseiconus nitratireducens]|uniref:Glycerophosphodiester phosphodiesterase n=1 Tax=Roseiconus nitratireducens TaxID=2605748 RepID=A0A5M6D2G5_9BACT|nr:glycerophosphodiester phosphodiesterase [Roseiconus nitratireducens]KAA5539335.1 glycerophosphodiester phosphodiesterase [Roseiconus nitratireducens]
MMFKAVMKNLASCWRQLVVVDLLFKTVAVVVLTPLVSLLFRLFLALSGRTVLADTDIARFLIHPIGWGAFLIVGGAVVGVFAIELAVLMMVSVGSAVGRTPRPRSVFRYVASKSTTLLRLAAWVVARIGLNALPFLAVGGAIFWMLLTEHDINFYLTEHPPEFWAAVVAIGFVLVLMSVLLLWRVIGWVEATPLVLFERAGAIRAITESERRATGRRRLIAGSLVGWFATTTLLRVALSATVVFAAQQVVDTTGSRLTWMVLALGLMILLVWLGNLVSGVVANISLGALLSMLYVDERGSAAIEMPTVSEEPATAMRVRLTTGRVVSSAIILLLGAGLLGVGLLGSIDFEDHVQITAHRGGAFSAPENTLASVRRGIEDGADWIEIDVQESSDGEIMVVHDSDLKKVAGDPVKIWQATAEQLRAIDIGSYFGPSYQDQRVPTLREVLEECRGKAGVNIELKYYGHTQDLERKVVDLVETMEMSDQVVVMSLELAGVRKIQQLRPDWTVGLLTAVAAGDLTRTDVDFLAVKDSLATKPFVDAAHRRGKTVAAWTLNDPYTMSLMISRGVDNLITDRPALARQVLADREAMSPVERLTLEVAYYLGIRPEVNSQQ